MPKNSTDIARADLMKAYADASINNSEIEALENVAQQFAGLKRSTVEMIVKAGELLTTAREKVKASEGNWQWFCGARLNTNPRTASRYIAAHNAVKNYGQLSSADGIKLIDVLDKIEPSALYYLGETKGVNEETIKGVIEIAVETGEVTADAAKDAKELASPKDDTAQEKPAQPIGFTPYEPGNAYRASVRLIGFTDEIYGAFAKNGVDRKVMYRNKEFKEFCQRVAKGNGETELEKSLSGLMQAAFAVQFSQTIEYES